MTDKTNKTRRRYFSRTIAFIKDLRKIIRIHRPAEIDHELEKMREHRKQAKKDLDQAKATLNGEDGWFIDKEKRK